MKILTMPSVSTKDSIILKHMILFIAACVWGLLLSTSALAMEAHIWDKKPIEIKLQKDVERIIHFPSNVKLGMSPGLRNKLTMTNAAGILYIKPKETFSKTRIFATLDNDEVLLIDFFAVDDKEPLDEFEIVHPKALENKKEEFTESIKEDKKESSKPTAATIKELIQYAIIDLYGPIRLLPELSVTTSEIKHPVNLNHVFIKRSAGIFELNAFKQYRTSQYTLTAIHLRNKTLQRQNIVLTDVYPAMIIDSSYETYVEPRSDDPMKRDSTTFFIVTKKPLVEYSFYSPPALKKQNPNRIEKDDKRGDE